jgi:hypothetical protein
MRHARKWLVVAGVGLVVLLSVGLALPVAGADVDASPTFHRGGIPGGAGDEFLADALGVTVEELQAARLSAGEAALQQAVDEGLLTQAQADALLERGMLGRFRFGGPHHGWLVSQIDQEALLADALGVTVDQLRDARQVALANGLAQAVEDGTITQEQADLMLARQSLMDYLQEQGLEDSLRALLEETVQQAVEAGVITQEQAETFLSDGKRFGKFGGMRGFDRFRGHGGMHGFRLPGDETAPSRLFRRGGAGFGSVQL